MCVDQLCAGVQGSQVNGRLVSGEGLLSGHQWDVLTALLSGKKGQAQGLCHKDASPLCGGSLPSSPIPLVTRLSVYEGGTLVPWQFTMPTPKTHKIHVLLKYKTSHSILIAPPPIFTPVSDQSLKICLRWLSGTNTLSLILRPTQWKRTDFLKLSSDLHTGCLCTHAHP